MSNKNNRSDWEAVIGLEVHAQLNTKSKMFSPDSTRFGAGDNDNIHPISLALPGTLPRVNHSAIEASIKMGLALNCNIRNISVFSRKNYFYPDLPKGYQISQFDEPLCENGYVDFFVGEEKKRIGITRAHMEEDAGKSTHHGEYTLINLNRAGIPLLEIVSEPEIKTSKEAAEYAKTIRSILRYLDVCDGNMEEGSLRCDCNVSVMKVGAKEFGTKVELKNINSFRFVEKAIDYEIQRQIDCLESGEEIIQETRLYDSTKNKTFAMRKKEQAHDYRYFPDPDLLPVEVKEEWINEIKSKLPELPGQRAARFQADYSLPEYDSLVLTQEKAVADYYEQAAKISNSPKAASNWIMTELMRELKEAKVEIENSPISAMHMGELVGLVEGKTLSGKMAKAVFAEMWKTGKDPKSIVADKGMSQITDPKKIAEIAKKIIAENTAQHEQYKSGKDKLFGFFVGQMMKASKGQASPEVVNKVLKELL